MTPGPQLPPTGLPEASTAGVLVWRPSREGNGGVEVLLVRRTDRDGWTWPAGSPERRESLPECAVRQAAELAGLLVVLGRPLPPARCTADGDRADGGGAVAFWAARPVSGGRRTARPGGAGDVRWVPVEQVRPLLADPHDTAPLQALERHVAEGTLATWATLVVRHATARPRDSWARADADRPLVASGRRQALALGALLQCWRPDQVLSSPWLRCLETMNPYVVASGARMRTKGGLSEAGHERSPGKASRHARSLLESGHGGVLCTHRPVLGAVLDAVRARCAPDVAALVPDANPYLHPGDVLVAHVARPGQRHHGHPVVVAVERHGTR